MQTVVCQELNDVAKISVGFGSLPHLMKEIIPEQKQWLKEIPMKVEEEIPMKVEEEIPMKVEEVNQKLQIQVQSRGNEFGHLSVPAVEESHIMESDESREEKTTSGKLENRTWKPRGGLDMQKMVCHGCGDKGLDKRDCPNYFNIGLPVEKCFKRKMDDDVKVCMTQLPRVVYDTYITITIGSNNYQALLDTGCSVSCIEHKFVPHVPLNSNRRRLYAANGTPIKSLGQFTLKFRIGNKDTEATLQVCEALNEMILGVDWLTRNYCRWDFRARAIWFYGERIALCERERHPIASKKSSLLKQGSMSKEHDVCKTNPKHLIAKQQTENSESLPTKNIETEEQKGLATSFPINTERPDVMAASKDEISDQTEKTLNSSGLQQHDTACHNKMSNLGRSSEKFLKEEVRTKTRETRATYSRSWKRKERRRRLERERKANMEKCLEMIPIVAEPTAVHVLTDREPTDQLERWVMAFGYSIPQHRYQDKKEGCSAN